MQSLERRAASLIPELLGRLKSVEKKLEVVLKAVQPPMEKAKTPVEKKK